MNQDTQSFLSSICESHSEPKLLPGELEVKDFLQSLMRFMYPELSFVRLNSETKIEAMWRLLRIKFKHLLSQTHKCDSMDASSICSKFFEGLPQVRKQSLEDAQAICDGDPAAYDVKEVIRSYPGFYATAIYRIAHLLADCKVPYLPRIFTEFGHARTAIDIHPKAEIGSRFCIDHGTGVVIGETTEIGDDVKIYQGVTLGALSIDKSLASVKRHPTIKDGVVIYANATILGGDTVIGKGAVIGGNAWITKSVEAGVLVYYDGKDMMQKSS